MEDLNIGDEVIIYKNIALSGKTKGKLSKLIYGKIKEKKTWRYYSRVKTNYLCEIIYYDLKEETFSIKEQLSCEDNIKKSNHGLFQKLGF
jgi:hypothetical protein